MNVGMKVLYLVLSSIATLLFGGIMFGVTYFAQSRMDHILPFVPANATAYFHDRDGNATSFLKVFFPGNEDFFVENQETGIVVNTSQEVVIMRYQKKNIVIESRSKKAVTEVLDDLNNETAQYDFARHTIGSAFRQKQVGLFPVYGILTESFQGNLRKTLPWIDPNQKGIQFLLARQVAEGAFDDIDEKATWALRFQLQSRLGFANVWGFQKTEVQILEGYKPVLFVSPGDIDVFQKYTDLFTPFAALPRVIRKDFPQLIRASNIIVYKEGENTRWLITWPQMYDKEVALLVQKLAQEAFPQGSDSTTLPDGSSYATLVPSEYPFPSQDTNINTFKLRQYKKDTWELNILESTVGIVLTNMLNPVEKLDILNKPKPDFLASSNKQATVYDRMGKDYNIYIVKNQRDEALFGYMWK
ncbi:MAG: hypothetical protein A3B74_02005 [Candidatus Kerfeldbacteria bacterium RIFCSPHIGHO2_02_FULL_42_14]|uniref:Uncharacterized protein n=1 Tax=Candidatus Kerfeldbacteria bacterium RIFCSPHIGHO2_02_FULL_42_14 TaxID=1798540 RepID=A0A1G2AR02_9BACT|nr:MAG: hypothetical protein A3B74_02005 [Candidatus Kerfeldbacteria bacterium RIFCSPHIGHO2_02_FULL_42_14]OGY81792.1 MAG: hypothetical protein A3E60_00580 [Candidatus Kerfeldbacteria bacterium RIFCSPHIGHO2_12_FULL_42_13]OGY84481.1 MAG: hypothetical protein A3I91_00195 [Candidatus Kerfeldbacteria bacterium RIFCSPLOWO2_02_FULL_42_19]OGY87979.1 MAG: hypothetical protein A3G01_04135 [Candidatus Kerfeldbacteria bacterium RIFCSPLOWO2_12_FULL_43_9]